MNTFDANDLRADILKHYGNEKMLTAAMKIDPEALSSNISSTKEINMDEVKDILFKDWSDDDFDKLMELWRRMLKLPKDKFDLAIQIMDLCIGHPDRWDYALAWTGKMKDLPAALAQI